MSLYDINGVQTHAYDIDGNKVCDDSEKDRTVGYVVKPQYKTMNGNNYRLVWHDEFEEDDLDKNYWEDQYIINSVKNRYQAQSDYYLENSIVHIRLKKDAPNRYATYVGEETPRDIAHSSLQTGEIDRLHTLANNHDVNPFWGLLTQEGYWECRMKVFKATGGCHTAWWCVGIQDGLNFDVTMAEIDVTEILGHETNRLPHGQHKQADDSVTELYRTTDLTVDLATEFHTVGFLWENGIYKWYVDGLLVDTMTINTPQYPVMHLLSAYKTRSGSNWTGEADPSLRTKDVEFQIDYLRIYKKATSVSSGDVTIDHYSAINIDGANSNMSIDVDRGCPLCFPSYVYVYWSDGSRTEHWVKWQAVQETYNDKMTNHQSFEWAGYVYGLGIDVAANISY